MTCRSRKTRSSDGPLRTWPLNAKRPVLECDSFHAALNAANMRPPWRHRNTSFMQPSFPGDRQMPRWRSAGPEPELTKDRPHDVPLAGRSPGAYLLTALETIGGGTSEVQREHHRDTQAGFAEELLISPSISKDAMAWKSTPPLPRRLTQGPHDLQGTGRHRLRRGILHRSQA